MGYLKPELSVKNKYWLPKHRYYELRHYCLQYPDWKDLYFRTEPRLSVGAHRWSAQKFPGDPTGKLALLRAECSRNMELVERVAKESDGYIYTWLLKAVTEDVPFSALQTVYGIPCGKDMFYDRYRKFYWLLSQEKGL